MDLENLVDLVSTRLEKTDVNDLPIGDLVGLALLHLHRRDIPLLAETLEGNCRIKKVDDLPPPTGWQCRCFTNGGITTYSFQGPGFPSWVGGGDGGIKNAEPRFTVVDPMTGVTHFVVADCG